MAYLPRFAKIFVDFSTKGSMETPEKPCPWHAAVVNPRTGRLGHMYCEMGPDGHEGPHIGERSRQDFLRMLRAWRNGERKLRKKSTGEANGDSEKPR